MNDRYSLKDGASFVEQARTATFDLTNDDGATLTRQRHGKQLNWDKKKKKFVQGTGEGADNVKMVRTESGTKLPASYRSGRFEEWKAKTRVNLPKVGEAELSGRYGYQGKGSLGGQKRFRHTKTMDAKALDPRNIGYERKARQFSKKEEKAAPPVVDDRRKPGQKGGHQPKKGVRFAGKPIGKVKNELKSAEAIRKARKIMEKKRLKNARAPRKGRK
jgi:ATP-dependent RNA helicase DDX54/DBP10